MKQVWCNKFSTSSSVRVSTDVVKNTYVFLQPVDYECKFIHPRNIAKEVGAKQRFVPPSK